MACEYAEFLLEDQENEDKLKEICAAHLYTGDVKPLVGNSYLDDEGEGEDKILYNEFMDAHGLLLEL